MLRFFRWFCDPECVEDIEGDLLERFEKRLIENKNARLQFVMDVLRLFRPGIIKPLGIGQKLNNYAMINNYYKVSIRNILRNKTFSLLNITGLSVGIACCLLIMIYVKNELSYDTYHSKYDRIHRVLHYFGTKEFPSDERFPIAEHQVWGNAPVGEALINYYPEIEHIFQFSTEKAWLVEYGNSRFQETNIPFADSTAFEVFDWKMHAGDPATCLVEPNTIVLSLEMAKKVFGNENPIGKTLLMDAEDQMKVTGVYEIPSNSHFSYDAMISMSTFKNRRPQIFDTWGYVDFYTYFTIHEEANIVSMIERIPDFITDSEVRGYTVSFEPLADAYLNSEAGRQPGPVGNKKNIFLFISVAVFVMIIAAINFMNLSTARSVERAKEVAIRKTIGSQRGALIVQFLVESVLLTIIAGLFACCLVAIGHNYLEILVGKPLPMEWLMEPMTLLGMVAMLLVLGILTGSYPAFVLSKFKPVKVLKGSFKNSFEGIRLRKILVILQFTLSVILLVGTTVVYNQLSYLKGFDKGFDSERVLVIDYAWDGRVQRNIEVIKSAFKEHSAVQSVGASRATPGEFFPNGSTGIEDPSGEMIFIDPAIYEVQEGFIPTYDMEIIAGRNYSVDFPTDSSSSLVINEALAREYGYANPADVVGKKFSQWGREGTVIGVVSDFNYVSLHKDVEPLALRYATKWSTSRISIKLKSNNFNRSLAELEDLWNEVVPYHPFVAYFNDVNFNEQYETDERFGNVFTVFSGFAVFVACLGLFGLTIYSTTQRSKEIGVRKVLGASIYQLVSLLSKDFVKLFVVALILSVPISWYIMNKWLESFAYRVNIDWKMFAFAAGVTFFVAMVTMSLKTIRAALDNPTESLRDE